MESVDGTTVDQLNSKCHKPINPNDSPPLKNPQTCALDFLSLGALVNCLDPGSFTYRKANHCDNHVRGGDGYTLSLFSGLLSVATEQEAVSLGWAHGTLLTTFLGDMTMVTVEQVKTFA